MRLLVLLLALLLPSMAAAACPDLQRHTEFEAEGLGRRAIVLAPESPPPGLPLIFVWHGLGSDARGMVGRLGLLDLAAHAVVVVPEADPGVDLGWGYTGSGRHDFAVYDVLRRCAEERFATDPDRVVSVGWSAGALWSTRLLMERADELAAVVLFSGGLFAPLITWRSPAWSIPVLTFDGGPWDTYRKGAVLVRFDRNTRRLVRRLRTAGHHVRHCSHGGGHYLPSYAREVMWAWALSARRGTASTPQMTIPAWCVEVPGD